MSDDEGVSEPASIKKSRLGLVREDTEVVQDELLPSEQTEDAATAEGVKEVTDGVRDVELEESKASSSTDAVPAETAAAVPLPDSPTLEAQPSEAAPPEATEGSSLTPDANADEKVEQALKSEQLFYPGMPTVVIDVDGEDEEQVADVTNEAVEAKEPETKTEKEEEETAGEAPAIPDDTPTPVDTTTIHASKEEEVHETIAKADEVAA